jgi:acetyltransferase
MPSPVRVARSIAMLARYREARDRNTRKGDAPESGTPHPSLAFQSSLGEAESKAILEDIGVAVTRDALVSNGADVRLASLTPPFAVKIASPDIPHKTEIGGVRLGVQTPGELAAAIDEVLTNARTMAPDARIDGVIVSEMLTGGFELLAGVVNDVVFGPVVVVGAGGIYAETLKDTSCRLAPFDERTARDMIDELRCRPILSGTRGQPALDVGAVARSLAALSRFAWENRDTIREIDINPLFALPAGAVAADALIVLKKVNSA